MVRSLDPTICPRCNEPMAAVISQGSLPRYLCDEDCTMNEYASITWGRNKQGKLIPLAVSYAEPIIIESQIVVRRNMLASVESRELSAISLPKINAFSQPLEPLPIPKKAAAPRSARCLEREARIAKIRAAHQRMKRAGILPDDKRDDLLSEWRQ